MNTGIMAFTEVSGTTKIINFEIDECDPNEFNLTTVKMQLSLLFLK